MAARKDSDPAPVWYGEHIGKDRGWERNGDARLQMLISRLAGQETAWDRVMSRIATSLGLAIAVGGAGAAVLVSQSSAPTAWQWALVIVMGSLFLGVVGCGLWQFRSRVIYAGPNPAILTEWLEWEGARERWTQIMGEAIERNRNLLERARQLSNAMLDFLVLEVAAGALLDVTVLLEK
jgi:hypothetical protein